MLQLKFVENRVTGVEINKGGEMHQVGANKEVIVSAGAIESPKILMLSGIGPRDHLQKLGVSDIYWAYVTAFIW